LVYGVGFRGCFGEVNGMVSRDGSLAGKQETRPAVETGRAF